MLIKGEKYACEACVRGHRVSNCQHADRPLQHINKKVCTFFPVGRNILTSFYRVVQSLSVPTAELYARRDLRMLDATVVKSRMRKDSVYKTQIPMVSSELPETSSLLFLTLDKADICCCSHGARCSCALKKEHLDPVLESDSDEASSSSIPSSDIRRPRALTAQSDTGLTVFANGHHKPVHKHNTMAHKCGLPYVVPRSHSIHGPSPSGLANRSVDNLPHTNTIDALHSESHIKDSMVSAQQEQRMVKSEHGSPIIAASNLGQLNGLLPPLDLSSLPEDYSYQSLDSYSSVPDLDQPLFSAGLSTASIDWSHYDGLDFNNDEFAASSYSQAPSFTGFDFTSSIDQPALTTTSTSGEISEVEDFVAISESAPKRPGLPRNQYGSDFDNSDFGGDVDSYRLSTASSYVGLPQAQMLASNNVGAIDMDSFLKGLPASNSYVETNHGLPPTSYPETSKLAQTHPQFDDNIFSLPLLSTEEEAFWMGDFAPGHLASNSARSDPFKENVWASQ
jgi:hypothetical protein